MNNRIFGNGVFITGAIFSIVLRIIFPEIYHNHDVTTFVQWGSYAEIFRNIYLTDCFCNYPIIGLLASAGTMQLLNYNIFQFLIYLSFVDLINVLLFWIIVRSLETKNAFFWSGLFGLLPSTWVGGAFWGQIDNLGQTWILLFLLIFIFWIKKLKYDTKFPAWMYIATGLLIYFTLFTKQLLWFPLSAIGLMTMLLLIYKSDIRKIIHNVILILGSFFTLLVLFDLWVHIPENYVFSHIEKVLLEGSSHINVISGNGFNIWMLFYPEMHQSSEVQVFWKLSPKLIGIVIFCIAFTGLSITFLKGFIQNFHGSSSIILIGFFCLFLALVNLSFNLFMTGTHERYLYYFYPYILVAFLCFRLTDFIKKFDFIVLITGAILYGFFVLAILQNWLDSTLLHQALFIFHFIFGIRLMWIFLRFAERDI